MSASDHTNYETARRCQEYLDEGHEVSHLVYEAIGQLMQDPASSRFLIRLLSQFPTIEGLNRWMTVPHDLLCGVAPTTFILAQDFNSCRNRCLQRVLEHDVQQNHSRRT